MTIEEIIGETPTKVLKDDSRKVKMSLLLPSWLHGVASVLTFGASKYYENSWKEVGNAKQRYLNAAYRHLIAYHSGEKVDVETGESHLLHLSCCIMFLYFFERKENE